MTLQVLQSKADIAAARSAMENRGVSCLSIEVPPQGSFFSRLFARRQKVQIGDFRKSWDVLCTADFVAQHLPKTARVLDFGAYNSEILPVLHRMGFTQLTGMDLNPGITGMPYADAIAWQVGDFLHAPFPDGSFDAITAISVIEHDFDADRLMREVSRLLAPGGCFLASFDYWPEKIPTDAIRIFDMSWIIFSRDDVNGMVERAAAYGLVPTGPLAFEAGERAIQFADRDYTFAWIVFRKSTT
jgi:SAM-dependent methyltransferase